MSFQILFNEIKKILVFLQVINYRYARMMQFLQNQSFPPECFIICKLFGNAFDGSVFFQTQMYCQPHSPGFSGSCLTDKLIFSKQNTIPCCVLLS